MVTHLHRHDKLDIYLTRIFDKKDTALLSPQSSRRIGVRSGDDGHNVCRQARKEHGWPRDTLAAGVAHKHWRIYRGDTVMDVRYVETK